MRHNAVGLENAREGTPEWRLSRPYPRLHGGVRSSPIEGYALQASVAAGEELMLCVSADPGADVLVELFRSGWYGGLGGRKVAEWGPLACAPQPTPPIGTERLRACAWEPSLTVRVPPEWVSGVYLAKLTEQRSGYQSYATFIVRDERECELIFGCADLTWQAYNHWPDLFSLYNDGYRAWWNGRGVAVSRRRPYGKYPQQVDAPASVGSGEWLLWELPMAYWLERAGHDVSYQSGLDLHRAPERLRRANGYLSVGHDEYYTLDMFEGLRAAVADGLNAGFFCGNGLYGVIEFLDDELTAFHRVDAFGRRPSWLQGEIRDFPWRSPDANELMGAGLAEPVVGIADWTCVAAEHWAFAGSGMRGGDAIEGLVGWEFHGDPARRPGLEVLATGTTEYVEHGELLTGRYTATAYEGEHGNTVFNAATCWWGDGLAAPPGQVRPGPRAGSASPDPRVEAITANVVERLRVRRWSDAGV
ncbi:MAG TPA: N,N-dimethylformamidase beta subunit family domain-containing protein [Conexibacter sp.]|jgi:hypothetical protein|nr:N,N-dimethylformamidase beta subunit family domain-containing protein [Conexibacter sp.]